MQLLRSLIVVGKQIPQGKEYITRMKNIRFYSKLHNKNLNK